jgi:NAD-dependent dihydropyrimidine dehydrogenase PreA subunit
MAIRDIVQIDPEKCDGCGQCVSACAEGAIQLIDGVAKLVRDDYCDGLGACLGECPRGAITIITRDAPAFDEQAVAKHLQSTGLDPLPAHAQAPVAAALPHPAVGCSTGGCPGAAMRQFAPRAAVADNSPAPVASQLRQWPVQLHLVNPSAPYFQGADLLLAADCAAFAVGDFHARFLKDKALAIACPKLDNVDGYVEKLAAILRDAGAKSLTIVRMQAPCCGGLERLAQLALQQAGVRIPVRRVVVAPDGDTLLDESVIL